MSSRNFTRNNWYWTGTFWSTLRDFRRLKKSRGRHKRFTDAAIFLSQLFAWMRCKVGREAVLGSAPVCQSQNHDRICTIAGRRRVSVRHLLERHTKAVKPQLSPEGRSLSSCRTQCVSVAIPPEVPGSCAGPEGGRISKDLNGRDVTPHSRATSRPRRYWRGSPSPNMLMGCRPLVRMPPSDGDEANSLAEDARMERGGVKLEPVADAILARTHCPGASSPDETKP